MDDAESGELLQSDREMPRQAEQLGGAGGEIFGQGAALEKGGG